MNTLKKNLTKLGIDETWLTPRELEVITKIQELYDSYVEKHYSLKNEIQENKFNKNIVANHNICSRQTLYGNETICRYMQLLELQAETLSNVDERKYVSKEKFDNLKAENEKLISNAVDVELKNFEIQKLTHDNVRLRQEVATLRSNLANTKRSIDSPRRH